MQALKLLELLMEHHVGIVCQSNSAGAPLQVLASMTRCGRRALLPDQALLPDDLRNFDGYRLLQEYFAFPQPVSGSSAFRGLRTLMQRKAAMPPRSTSSFCWIRPMKQLERVVDASHLALHCTPVINLFPKVAERQKLNESQHEYHLVVDNIRPLDYEIYAVQQNLRQRGWSAR